MTNNLVVLEEREMTNKQLNTQLKKAINGLKGVEKGNWQYATAIHQIIVKDLYKDDFKDIDEFAKYIETTSQNLTKLYKAVEWGTNHGLIGIYTVSKCYLLSTIKDYDDFTNWCIINDIDVSLLSKHQLEDVLKAYKETLKKPDKNAIDNEDNETNEETIEEEIEYADIKWKKQMYHIPVSILSQYLLIEED